MQDDKAAGGSVQKGGSAPHEEYHCNPGSARGNYSEQRQ